MLLSNGEKGQIACDAAQPGLEPAEVLQLAELLPGGDEGLLCHVFAAGEISHDAVRDGADERLMPRDQLAERFAVSPGGSLEQVDIGGRLHWRLAGSTKRVCASSGSLVVFTSK